MNRVEHYKENDIGKIKPYERMLRIIYAKMPNADEFDHIDLVTGVSSYCELWHGGQFTQVYALGSGILAVSRNLHCVDPTAADFSWETTEWYGAAMVYCWLHDDDHKNAKRYFPRCFDTRAGLYVPIEKDLKSQSEDASCEV